MVLDLYMQGFYSVYYTCRVSKKHLKAARAGN